MNSCPYCAQILPTDLKQNPKPIIIGCKACMNPLKAHWEKNAIHVEPLSHVSDIRQMVPAGSIGGAILAELPNVIENLPVLPEIAQRVLGLVRDPEVALNDLVNTIRGDQTIALKIMRLANSPVYGGLQEIKDLGAACARLGMKTICDAVQAIATNNLYTTQAPQLKDFMQQLWRHSMAVALYASELGGALAMPRTESLFLAGLIHDVGKTALVRIISSAKEGPIAAILNSPDILNEIFHSFHALIGLHITQHWTLPSEFLTFTYTHHDPSIVPNDDWLPFAHVVALANAIAKVDGYTVGEGSCDIVLMGHPSTRYLNLTDIKLASLRVDLEDKLDAMLNAAAG